MRMKVKLKSVRNLSQARNPASTAGKAAQGQTLLDHTELLEEQLLAKEAELAGATAALRGIKAKGDILAVPLDPSPIRNARLSAVCQATGLEMEMELNSLHEECEAYRRRALEAEAEVCS